MGWYFAGPRRSQAAGADLSSVGPSAQEEAGGQRWPPNRRYAVSAAMTTPTAIP